MPCPKKELTCSVGGLALSSNGMAILHLPTPPQNTPNNLHCWPTSIPHPERKSICGIGLCCSFDAASPKSTINLRALLGLLRCQKNSNPPAALVLSSPLPVASATFSSNVHPPNLLHCWPLTTHHLKNLHHRWISSCMFYLFYE